jgi:hypothetical protein
LYRTRIFNIGIGVCLLLARLLSRLSPYEAPFRLFLHGRDLFWHTLVRIGTQVGCSSIVLHCVWFVVERVAGIGWDDVAGRTFLAGLNFQGPQVSLLQL